MKTISVLLALVALGTVSRTGQAFAEGDPPGFRLDDCSTQRNLSDYGRNQARQSAALQGRGLDPGAVGGVSRPPRAPCRRTSRRS